MAVNGLGYTVPAVAAVAVVVLVELRWRTGLFGRRAYWLTMAIVFGFQVAVDGWLTKASAPIVSMIPALLSFSVIPFGPDLKIADVNVSLLLIFAITSLGVYGIVLGGWASNSKYPLMGAMRSSACG